MGNRLQQRLKREKKRNIVILCLFTMAVVISEEESYANTKTSFKMSEAYFEPENTIVYYLGVDYMDDKWLIISLDKGIANSYCIDVT